MELSDYLDLERNYITRARTDLFEEGFIKKGVNRICRLTKQYVQTWEYGEPVHKKENRLSDTQMKKVKRYIEQANKYQLDKIIKMCELRKARGF
jgi:predicted transcriptional regulator